MITTPREKPVAESSRSKSRKSPAWFRHEGRFGAPRYRYMFLMHRARRLVCLSWDSLTIGCVPADPAIGRVLGRNGQDCADDGVDVPVTHPEPRTVVLPLERHQLSEGFLPILLWLQSGVSLLDAIEHRGRASDVRQHGGAKHGGIRLNTSVHVPLCILSFFDVLERPAKVVGGHE